MARATFSPTHHPPEALVRVKARERVSADRVSSLVLGVSVRGSHRHIIIYMSGGSSGHLLSARIAYLQDKSWKVGYPRVSIMYRTTATLGVFKRHHPDVTKS